MRKVLQGTARFLLLAMRQELQAATHDQVDSMMPKAIDCSAFTHPSLGMAGSVAVTHSGGSGIS